MLSEGKLLCESKYGEPRYYDEQADGTYLVYGPSHFVRTVKGQFDFEGGPYLSVGDPFIIENEKILKLNISLQVSFSFSNEILIPAITLFARTIYIIKIKK